MGGWTNELHITVGDGSAADSKLVFDGAAQDFYIGIDDGTDDLYIGLGDTVGTTPIITMDENRLVTVIEKITFSLGLVSTAEVVTPNSGAEAGSLISAGITAVDIQTVSNDSNDFVVLPSLANVPIGHTITILCNAGGNFEMRTPATSNEKINNQDSDGGAKEYLCTDTEVIKVIKIDGTVGWMAHAFSAIGAVVTAVVPHAN